MPERFLLQILRNLVTHGILRSTRGVEGGYRLTRSPDQISLLDVIEAIEGPIDSGDPLSGDLPEVSQSKLREALDEVTATSKKQLSAIKLSHLIPHPKTRSSKKEKHE
jgi:Rrf2 family protein